jgi:DNA-binding NarL/FixJ family response regulator
MIMKVARILIVDDHPIVRRGLAELIAGQPDLRVCGEAAGASEALQQLAAKLPDLAIVDISLKDSHGIQLIKQIKTSYGNRIKIVVASMHDELLFTERVLRAGAMGYINKEDATEKVIEAIRRVLGGEVYLSQRMTDRLLNRAVGSGTDLKGSPLDRLTDREMEVFDMIGQALTTRQIAHKLHLSPKTVQTHRENLKTKLNLKNSTELVRQAVQRVLEKN